MLTKHTNLIVGVCLLLSALACIGIEMTTRATDNTAGQLPRRSIVITIDTSQREKFFDQLRNFAGKHGFTIIIDTRASGDENFLIAMYRGDIETHGANPFVLGEYELGFYDADRQHPVSESAFDDLISDLESFISEVPGATFSVEK